MDLAPDIDVFWRFILLVFPGMVTMRVYRLLKSARELEWQNSLVEAIFFSVVNFSLWLPFLPIIGAEGYSDAHPMVVAFCLMTMILVSPMLLAVIYAKLQGTWLTRGLMLQHTTASDYFFDRKIPCFVLVHLKDGQCIAGYYGTHSFASSAPRHGDLYLEHVYPFDRKTQTFGTATEGSAGMLVRAEDYILLEFFRPPRPTPQETTHDHRTERIGTTSPITADPGNRNPSRIPAGGSESGRPSADQSGAATTTPASRSA